MSKFPRALLPPAPGTGRRRRAGQKAGRAAGASGGGRRGRQGQRPALAFVRDLASTATGRAGGAMGASGKTPLESACDRYAVDLSAYFDRELEGEALRALLSHLAVCLACRAELEKMRRLREAVVAPPGHHLRGKTLVEAVLSRLDKGR